MTQATITIYGHEYNLTTDHAMSSYGQPVLVGEDGTAYGRDDAIHVQDDPMPWLGPDAAWCTVASCAKHDYQIGLLSAQDYCELYHWAHGMRAPYLPEPEIYMDGGCAYRVPM